MTVPDGLGLAALNALPEEEARQVLLACCSSSRWAAEVAARRPYDGPDELLAVADRVLGDLSDADLDEALAGHPRIGDRPASGGWSQREQRGVAGAGRETLAKLAEGNRAYEERFGHVYLVCADGRSADDLLGVLEQRLGNDPRTEHEVLREELGKINRIRLVRLLKAEAA